MNLSKENNIIDWKRLWQLVSGILYETPESTVQEELLNVSAELQDGLLQFRPIDATNVKLETLLREKKQEKLLPFTQKLQSLLDLESKQCWGILCYYLSNEYRGTASSLSALISTESNMTKLLDDIWGYYTLERMIVLKVVKSLITFYTIPNHPYHREYKHIVDKISLEKLRKSYIKQLEHLINERPPPKVAGGEFLNYQNKLIAWSERNAREIIEVVHILIIICDLLPIGLVEVRQLFSCFKQHSFGKQQRYFDQSCCLHAELVERLTYSEIMLFLKCLDLSELNEKDLASDIIEALDTDVARMYHNAESGPILFAWMLFNLRFKGAKNEQIVSRYSQFGKRAVDLNCFNYMRALVTHSMFKDDSLISRIVRKTIYKLLNYMCDVFDEDGSCAQYPFIYELLCELVSWPTLAKEFCDKEDAGVRSLYKSLLEVFPLSFIHISMLAEALTKAGMGNFIKHQLVSLPIITDLYENHKYVLDTTGDDEYILIKEVKPFPRVEFTINSGTAAVIMKRPQGDCIHFRTCVNYFNVLHHEINCLLSETVQFSSGFQNLDRVRRVDAGLRYLHSELQHTEKLSSISVEMVHPTEMCIDLLNKFKTIQNPPVNLLANCLNVCTSLLPLVDVEIFTRIVNLNILPVITNHDLNDFKKYAHGMCFDSGLVGSYLVYVEKKTESYDFLISYLGFLRAYSKLQRNNIMHIELPGVVFLLREVFPHMHTWHFKRQSDKNKIYAEIMGLICEILDYDPALAERKNERRNHMTLLRDICVYSLLNLENGLVMLRFVALGNAYLQHTMEMEANWLKQADGLVLLVRLAMRILMQLLRLKNIIFQSEELSPLESLIYTQPKQRDTLRIIPVVTTYMSNIFDRWLPILSCRLLKRIALEFNMSLLACLDMEPDQIRMTFLQKLPDDLESDSLKMAILEFVEACIEKQPGMTEAFFKINTAKENRIFGKDAEKQITDSVITFMEDYLIAVAKEPTTIDHGLPNKVMNLFYSLWKHNLQILVTELKKKPNFWERLCNPLFSPLRPNVRTYTQLFNIMGIEMYCNPPADNSQLKMVIQKFFETQHFENWLEFIFTLPKNFIFTSMKTMDEMPDWLCRIEAFKGFLIILLKKKPIFYEIPRKQFKLLAQKGLKTLVEYSQYLEDLRPFILLSETYLCILLNYKHSHTDSAEEFKEMLKLLIELLNHITISYEALHVRAKEAFLAIVIKSTDLLAGEMYNDATVTFNFLNSVVNIICIELQGLETCVKTELDVLHNPINESACIHPCANSSTNSIILSLNLLKTISTTFRCEAPKNWDSPFITNRVLQRLLSCTSAVLPLHEKQSLSVELLDVLIIFAKGDCCWEFLHANVGDYLWLNLLPPKELLQPDYGENKAKSPNSWVVEKWWPIYTRGIDLVTILVHKLRHHFITDALLFVGIHCDYLVDSLLLGKQSLEPLAITLIKSAVTLVANLVEFEKHWRLEHQQSLFNLMRSVQILLSHSISMFHQPKNLKCLVAGRRYQLDLLRETENTELIDEVISAFNELTEIIIFCVKCLRSFSPDLLTLICDSEFLITSCEPLFDIHFGAPKLNENSITLSFGAVLSIISVYTKVLNLQNYSFHEAFLNTLPANLSKKDGGISSNISNKSPSSVILKNTQRPFSKSLSVTSGSSASCPPNELLSSLDGDLCLLALEHLLWLAASQSMLALKNPNLPAREKQLVRRELSSELLTYHEFVRKKVLLEYREHKEIWHRRKHGLTFMHDLDASEGDLNPNKTAASNTLRTIPENTRSHSMDLRVSVVRRLHLQQQHQTPGPGAAPTSSTFEMSKIISPIGPSVTTSSESEGEAISSTPHLARPPLRRENDEIPDGEQPKRVSFADTEQTGNEAEEKDETQYFPPEEPKYSPLSFIQLVEEDYLHFMSNLFNVICQND